MTPSGVRGCYTQRTGAGIASGPGDQRTPKTGIRGSPPRPPAQRKRTILYLTRGESPGWMVAHGCVSGGRRGGGPRSPSLQPAGPQPLTSPRRCTIARCHRCPLCSFSRQSKMPRVPAVRIPASTPPSAHIYPGGPAKRACLPGGWLSAKRRRLIPFASAATSLEAPCSWSCRAHAGQLLWAR